MDRENTIVKVSVIGILVNIGLVSIKMVIGLASGSIAIVLDAVNNFTDGLTSFITIIGTKLASRAPDKKHPYGYGRIEYITTIVVAFFILVAGGSAIKESVESIINKTVAEYSIETVLIILVAIVPKFFISKYTISKGKEVEAHSLIVSGHEAFFDGLLSVGTLIAATISLFFGLSLEGFLGAAIGIAIIKSGGEMFAETIGNIIGARQDRELSLELKKYVSKYEGVNGVYDVILHNYGPTQHIGSIHIEVDSNMNAKQIHILSQHIVGDVFDKFGIIVTVGIYSSVGDDEEAIKLRHETVRIVNKYSGVMQIHGFYKEENKVGFDIVIDFKENATEIIEKVRAELKELYPEYVFNIILDLDFSE